MKLAGLLAIGTAVHAAMPYLPLIGPSPLRFETEKHPANAVPESVASPVTVIGTNTSQMTVTPTSARTNETPTVTATVAAAGSNQLSSGLATPIVSQSGDFDPAMDGFSPAVFALPTPDLLGITPQTLATYFHPVHFDTNALVVGAFPLSFVPPMPTDKSSHAEYIIK